MSEEILGKVLNKLIDLDAFVRENTVKKQDFDYAINNITQHIDGFVKLHETLDQEMVMLRAKVERFETRLENIEMCLGLATN